MCPIVSVSTNVVVMLDCERSSGARQCWSPPADRSAIRRACLPPTPRRLQWQSCSSRARSTQSAHTVFHGNVREVGHTSFRDALPREFRIHIDVIQPKTTLAENRGKTKVIECLSPIRTVPETVASLSVKDVEVRSHVGGLVKSFHKMAA